MPMPACCFIPYSCKAHLRINVAPCAFLPVIDQKAPQRVAAFIRYRDAKNLFSFDADKFTVFRAFNFEFHFTVCFSKQSVVTTATYVSASVEFGTTLTNDDATRQNGFATETLNARAFSF